MRFTSLRSALLAAVAMLLTTAGCGPLPATGGVASREPATPAPTATTAPGATPVPVPGYELYGFVPYWEMDATIADHLAQTPLTTLALFSVTDTAKGALDTRQTGYQRITGDPGLRLISEAHRRGVRVEVVFTSFGEARNRRFLADDVRRTATITALVKLVGELDLDGVCVDVEGIEPSAVEAVAVFVDRLRTALVAADPGDRLTVSTQANVSGSALAAAVIDSGADRVFLMGYDYRIGASQPGATAPLDRRDGDRDLRWSMELYAAAGVPPERLLLGLPLYGVTWPVAGPVIGAPSTGNGDAWIPRRHLDVLTDSAIVPLRDSEEAVEVYLFGSDGSIGPPADGATPPLGERTWTAVYVDSPATLAPKLALANEAGYAGAGFWAIGYERGLPGYRELMTRFAAGEPEP